MQTTAQTTDRVKVEFDGGYFFLPDGMKRLHVYKEEIQKYLVKNKKYITKWATDRVSFIKRVIRSAGQIYEKLFPRLKHDVLNIVAYLTSCTGVCNITTKSMSEFVQKRRARLESRKIETVKLPSENGVKAAYAAIRNYTNQFIFARLANKGTQSNVILDTKHPNFKNLMKEIWNIDVVFENTSSFFADGTPVHEPVNVPGNGLENEPVNVPAEVLQPIDFTEFEQHLQYPFLQSNVVNAFNAFNALNKEETLTEVNNTINKRCKDENQKNDVPEDVEVKKPTVYQDEKVAGVINSFLYNNQMDTTDMQRLYEIAMEFKSKCIPFGIDYATIFHEINDALKYIRNANNVRGYFYSTMNNKFKVLTTRQETVETEKTVNVSNTPENDLKTSAEDSSAPEWFRKGDHKKCHTSEQTTEEKSKWDEKRKQINEKLGLNENGELQQKDKDDELIEKAIKSGATLPQWYKDKTYKQHESLKETDEEKHQKQVELLERAISDAEDGSMFKEILQKQLAELKSGLDQAV